MYYYVTDILLTFLSLTDLVVSILYITGPEIMVINAIDIALPITSELFARVVPRLEQTHCNLCCTYHLVWRRGKATLAYKKTTKRDQQSTFILPVQIYSIGFEFSI